MAWEPSAAPRLEIDEFKLDEEWIGQAPQYFKWAKKAANAQLKLDQAKSKVELVKAQLDKEIRADPESYGLAKITETVVSQTILTRVDYLESLEALHAAKHEAAIIGAAVSALDHRKTALVKLVDLHGQNYFASPRAPDGSREAMGEVEKKASRQKGVRRKSKED